MDPIERVSNSVAALAGRDLTLEDYHQFLLDAAALLTPAHPVIVGGGRYGSEVRCFIVSSPSCSAILPYRQRDYNTSTKSRGETPRLDAYIKVQFSSSRPKPATAEAGSEKTMAPASLSGPALRRMERMISAFCSATETIRMTSFSAAMEIL